MTKDPTKDPAEQRYGPTSGELSGWFGVVLTTLLAVGLPLYEQDRETLRVAVGAALVGVLVWSYMLRPKIIVRAGETLLLRNVFSTWSVPLASVETVSIGALTRVGTTSGSYEAVGVGRPLRSMIRSSGRPAVQARAAAGDVVPDLVIEQVLLAAERARAAGHPPGPVTRIWATETLVVLGVLAFVLLGLSV